MIDKEKETSPWKALSTLFRKIKHFFEVLVKHIKRFFEVLFKKEKNYKTLDEKFRNQNRINIVIILLWLINLAWLLISRR